MTRCEACDPRCKLVQATGPEPCDFLFIGEKPGKEEDHRGRVFCGDTGTELDGTYLPLAGLSRKQVRVTNTVKCRLGGNNSKPTDKEILLCAEHWLPEEIERCQPKAIVLMGATACSLVPGIELDRDHGIPIPHDSYTRFVRDWKGWVWPMYHPAAGLHQTSLMIPLMEDFERIRLWARDRWSPPTAIPTDYRLIQSVEDLNRSFAIADCDWLEGGHTYSWLPMDTEYDPLPYSLQFSTGPGNGYMIRAEDEELISVFRAIITGGMGPQSVEGLMLHNALADLGPLEQMGVCGFKYRDTMQEAYHRGNLPQGLKAIGWRLFGVRMQSWRDLVMPYSRLEAIKWLAQAWDYASDHRERVETQLKTKLKVEMKPTQLERDIKRIISHSSKPDYDLWEKVQEAGVESTQVVDSCGPMPHASIRHVPLQEAVVYGCQDADVTGRFGAWLDRYETQELPEEDWDQ